MIVLKLMACHIKRAFGKKALCNSQHLLTTPKSVGLVERKFLWRSTTPFFPPPQIKTEKSGLGTRLFVRFPILEGLYKCLALRCRHNICSAWFLDIRISTYSFQHYNLAYVINVIKLQSMLTSYFLVTSYND